MKIIYLGTAAAEAVPALFCQCPVCEGARKTGGHEIRGRSGIIIDGTLMCDVPPDVFYSSLRAGICLTDIRNIVITHSHEDHLDFFELSNRTDSVTAKRRADENYAVNVYGNNEVCRILSPYNHGGLKILEAKPFEPFMCGYISAVALPADHKHDEDAFIYLFEDTLSGRRFLYGNDTGLFPAETMRYLRGIKCDAISLDCTFVMMSSERGHMGIDACEKLRGMLREQGTADSSTKFIVHHFSHNGFIPDGHYYSTADFEKICAERGFEVSYDTMVLEI